MWAARLNPGATTLSIEKTPDPQLRPGAVIVRTEAAFASAFIGRIVDGTGTFVSPERPFTPGMDVVGVVEQVSPEIRGAVPGQRVYCNPRYQPPLHAFTGERVFVGGFAIGPQSKVLMEEWRDGGYAERICVPAATVQPIPEGVDVAPAVLCRLGWLGTAYAALRKVNVAPGADVAVNGASGLVGSGAVPIALALGAGRVYAIGRRMEALKSVAALDDRVVVVTDIKELPPIDVALAAALVPDASSLEALLARLRRYGSFVITGAPKTPMSFPPHWLLSNDITLRGSSWFDYEQGMELIRLITSRALDLSAFQPQTFPLQDVNKALDAARELANPLCHVAVVFD